MKAIILFLFTTLIYTQSSSSSMPPCDPINDNNCWACCTGIEESPCIHYDMEAACYDSGWTYFEDYTCDQVYCAEDCPDCVDNDELVDPLGCATVVATFGCDYTWGEILVSDACPVTCGTCPTIPDGDCDCDGNQLDCNGECGGSLVVDECGVCDGGNADQDCAGVCYGSAYVDMCGICDDDSSNDCVQDCAGEWGGNGVIDDCGDCDGGNAADLGCGCFEPAPSGCDNACDSDLEFDECGVCGGDDSACTGCTDEYGLNYNPNATIDDGSCEYYEGEVDNTEPHIYWEFNTGPVSNEDYYDEHIYSWPLWYDEEGDACVEIPEQNYYICLAEINENTCGSGSAIDLAFIKIDYNGQEIERNYICDFNSESQYNDKARAIAYRNNSLYIVMYTRLLAENYPELNETGFLTDDYLIKFDLDGNKEWIRRFNECNDCSSGQFKDLDVDIDGNAVVLAKANNVDLNGADNVDVAYISKYSTLGDLEWVSLHHLPYEYISSDCNPNSYGGKLIDMYINENNELFFVGASNCNGDIPILGKADVSNGNILWVKNLLDEGIIIDYNYLNTVSVLPNGNIFVGGATGGYSAMGITDSDGNGISYRLIAECYAEPIFLCGGSIFDSVVTPDGNIAIVGEGTFTNLSYLGTEGFLMTVNENLDIMNTATYGTSLSAQADQIVQILNASDGSLLLAGRHMPNNRETAVLYNVSYRQGCTEQSSCNYNPYADYDNGSCWSPNDLCSCEHGEGAVADDCGQCNGNGYDMCDDDENGISNLEQWGYGAHSVSVTDVPEDQGGRVYLTFNKSFHDTDALRSETYTIKRKDGDNWVVVQAFGADASGTYTVEVNTLNNNETTQFSIVANMDEGNFSTYEEITGISLDNIFPSVPTGLIATISDGSVMLSWNEPVDDDFQYFSIFRNDELIENTIESSFTDNVTGEVEYYLTATDVNGNESVSSETAVTGMLGDTNADFDVNVLDIVVMVNFILGYAEPSDYEFWAADLNEDDQVNILDIVIIAFMILDDPLSRMKSISESTLEYGSGKLSLTADGSIAGIQLEVAGSYILTNNNLPNGWQLHNNENVILIFNMGGEDLTSDVLFEYEGDLSVISNIIADWNGSSLSADIVVVPDVFSIAPAYPNPFNPTTTLSFAIPTAADVSLSVYNMQGREVASLINGNMEAGYHSVVWNADSHSSGVYFIKMVSGEYVKTQKLMLIK